MFIDYIFQVLFQRFSCDERKKNSSYWTGKKIWFGLGTKTMYV